MFWEGVTSAPHFKWTNLTSSTKIVILNTWGVQGIAWLCCPLLCLCRKVPPATPEGVRPRPLAESKSTWPEEEPQDVVDRRGPRARAGDGGYHELVAEHE